MALAMTMTEFNQKRSSALRRADVEDVVITRDGSPAYRISRIVPQPRTLAAEIAAGRVTLATRPRRPVHELAPLQADLNLVDAALLERAAER